MKVGIITFHCANNLGAMLQAYGLASAVNQLGHDCEIIDYRGPRGYLLADMDSPKEILRQRGLLRGLRTLLRQWKNGDWQIEWSVAISFPAARWTILSLVGTCRPSTKGSFLSCGMPLNRHRNTRTSAIKYGYKNGPTVIMTGSPFAFSALS